MPLIDPITMTSSKANNSELKPTPAITLNTSPLAQATRHIQPLLLLSTLYLSFPSIVASPTAGLTKLLLPISILQVGYCAICVPASSSSSTSTAASSSTPAKKGKPSPPGVVAKKSLIPNTARHASSSGRSSPALTISNLGSTLLPLLPTLLLSAPLLTILAILLGAPFTTHHLQTVLCAIHLALLSALPLFHAHSMSSSNWSALLSAQSAVDEVYGGALGALGGAWLGAVPIPLDWDRAWQAWPITVVVGMYVGSALGRGLGASFRGKRMNLVVDEE